MSNVHIKHSIALFALAAFLGITFLPSLGMVNMERHTGTPMSSCPFMLGGSTLCTMSVLEHISSWQTLVTAVLPGIVALALFLAIVVLGFLQLLRDPPDRSPPRAYAPLRLPYALLLVSLLLGSAISPRAP